MELHLLGPIRPFLEQACSHLSIATRLPLLALQFHHLPTRRHSYHISTFCLGARTVDVCAVQEIKRVSFVDADEPDSVGVVE